MKRRIALLISLLLCLSLPAAALGVELGPVTGDTTYSYNYNLQGESVPAPDSYLPVREIRGEAEDEWNAPADLYVRDEVIYLLDNGNNRIIRLDGAGNTLGILAIDPQEVSLQDASGIFVDTDGKIYVTLTEQQTVEVFDQDGTRLQSIQPPASNVIASDVVYAPSKVAVGNDDRIYVVSTNVYQGILQFSKEGEFLRFFGSNRVTESLSTVIGNFFRRFFTNAQKSQMEQVLPTELSSLDIDERGFIYSSSAVNDDSKNELKKYDVEGNNILAYDHSPAQDVVMGTGDYGDIEFLYDTQNYLNKNRKIDTAFRDLAVDEDGFIYGLDTERDKVFQYDGNSNLLAIFGIAGNQAGNFVEPVAVDTLGERVLVLDRGRNCVMVFEPTAYSTDLKAAVTLYNQGLFQESEEIWLRVKARNENLALVYEGLGNARMVQGDYEGAMAYFRLASDKNGYNEAFALQRDETVAKYFYLLFAGVVIVLVAAWIWLARKTRETKPFSIYQKKRVNPFYTALHPFDGFEAVRFQEKGSVLYACLVIAAVFLARMLSIRATGYVFNSYAGQVVNLPYEFFQVVILFLVFTGSNYAISELNNGKGFYRHVFISTAYCLLPYVLCSLVATGLSTVLTLREAVLYTGISSLGLWWSVILIVISQIQIHMYSFGKTLCSLLLTLFGMMCVAFVAITLFSLLGQLGSFIQNIYNEIVFRL